MSVSVVCAAVCWMAAAAGGNDYLSVWIWTAIGRARKGPDQDRTQGPCVWAAIRAQDGV